jgi:iron uptake system component EfeO
VTRKVSRLRLRYPRGPAIAAALTAVIVGTLPAGCSPAPAKGGAAVAGAATPRPTRPAASSPFAAAVDRYAAYVDANATRLVRHTGAFCAAIDAGDIGRAKLLYPRARVYYEHIEPVAKNWGLLAVQIDGRWENPVTVRSQFIGFHRIEQLIWAGHTLRHAPALCRGLVGHERQLAALVRRAHYSPLQMAAGATELVNEAARSKISGEEERYSDLDLPTLQANMAGALEVFTTLKSYLLATGHAGTAGLILRRYAGVSRVMASFKAIPGYLDTGYLDYGRVPARQRRTLSAACNAFAEALSTLTADVS